jgi:O-antigen ligase
MKLNRRIALDAAGYLLLAFVILRPALDALRNVRLTGGLTAISAASLGVAAMCGWFIFDRSTSRGRSPVLHNFSLLFLLFLGVTSLSLFNSRALLLSLGQVMRFAAFIAVFYFVWIGFPGEKTKRLIVAIYLSSIIPISVGVYQWAFQAGNLITKGFNRIHGTFVHPNVFAEYLLMLFFLNLFVRSTLKPSGVLRLPLALFSWLILAQIYLTYCRGVWVALLAGMAIYYLLRCVRGYSSPKLRHLALVVIVLALAVAGGVLDRWQGVFDASRGSASSWNFRLLIWDKTFENLDSNLLFGQGLEMHKFDFGIAAHNDYVKTIYENGFLGLFLYLLPLFYLAAIALKKSLSSAAAPVANTFILLFVVVVSFLIISLVDNVQRSLVVMIYYFLLIGAMLNFHMQVRAPAASDGRRADTSESTRSG